MKRPGDDVGLAQLIQETFETGAGDGGVVPVAQGDLHPATWTPLIVSMVPATIVASAS